MSNQEKIVILTEAWYNYVSLDHHKDKDCHFYISTKYSYGNPPVYLVEHRGYVTSFEDVCGSYELAEKSMIRQLTGKINEEIEWLDKIKNNPEDYCISYNPIEVKETLQKAINDAS